MKIIVIRSLFLFSSFRLFVRPSPYIATLSRGWSHHYIVIPILYLIYRFGYMTAKTKNGKCKIPLSVQTNLLNIIPQMCKEFYRIGVK